MSTTSNINFTVLNEAFQIADPPAGVLFLMGETKRGPLNDPSTLITSPKKFRELFGNIDTASEFPLQCMAALERGAALRVCRIMGGSPVTAVSGNAVDGTDSLFHFHAKGPGTDYNNLSVVIKAATNANADYFDLEVTLSSDTMVTEYYANLKIVGTPTVAESTYLDIITTKSNLIEPQYADLSGLTAQLRPTNATLTFSTGTDGTTPILSDYTGSQATATGFHAFDQYDDAYAIACPELSESDLTGLTAAGQAYAEARKDLIYYQHLGSATAANLISERGSIDSPYVCFTAGGLEINHPITGAVTQVSELGYVLGNMCNVINTQKDWTAFFGPVNGLITGVLGVVHNFGSPAFFTDLDLLAQNRVNMVITRKGKTMFWDDYTSQVNPSPENFASTMNLIFYIKKTLGSILEKYIGKPTDFKLLYDLWVGVRGELGNLVNDRALFDYSWEGDQFATKNSDLQLNTPEDMQLGKVKVNLRIITISPLKEISVTIILTRAGVQFSI